MKLLFQIFIFDIIVIEIKVPNKLISILSLFIIAQKIKYQFDGVITTGVEI